MIGGWELFVILIIALVLFGGKRLPDLARNLGKGLREFRKASSGIAEEEVKSDADSKKECGGSCETCHKNK